MTMKKTTTITLTYPITHEGKTYQHIELRRATPGDIERLDLRQGGDTTKNIQLMADLAEMPPDAIRCLDMVDYLRLNEVISDFLPKTPLPPIGLLS